MRRSISFQTKQVDMVFLEVWRHHRQRLSHFLTRHRELSASSPKARLKRNPGPQPQLPPSLAKGQALAGGSRLWKTIEHRRVKASACLHLACQSVPTAFRKKPACSFVKISCPAVVPRHVCSYRLLRGHGLSLAARINLLGGPGALHSAM